MELDLLEISLCWFVLAGNMYYAFTAHKPMCYFNTFVSILLLGIVIIPHYFSKNKK